VRALKTLGLLSAFDVFREGAENRTRGACAPHFNSGFWDEATGLTGDEGVASTLLRRGVTATRRLLQNSG
jgi:hypothetical protein